MVRDYSRCLTTSLTWVRHKTAQIIYRPLGEIMYTVKLINEEILEFNADGYDVLYDRVFCFYLTLNGTHSKVYTYKIPIQNVLYIHEER